MSFKESGTLLLFFWLSDVFTMLLPPIKKNVNQVFHPKKEKDFFEKKKGLQTSTCSHVKPCASAQRQRKGKLFFRGGKTLRGRAVITVELS